MSQGVCPWWFGYFLTCPLRRLAFDPAKFLAPYVQDGMTVLEPGPGMGFCTLELARLVGPRGRVLAVDIQTRMLQALRRRAAKAGLLERIEARLATPDSLALDGLDGAVDFALAFAMVHEMPSVSVFFTEAARALRPGACLLLAEPSGHVKAPAFQAELDAAAQAGFEVTGRPHIRSNQAALLKKV
jgi:ubiquinone/menaquinone biosynthesis C-methylase UbiE